MYYFAYSSNMSLEHVRRLCGWHCRILGSAILPDFEFGFDGRGFANVRPKKGDSVQGVLYEVDPEGLSILDDFQDYPEVFERPEVNVKIEGKIFKAWVYIQPPQEFGGKARKEHLDLVIRGAESNHLPMDWIEKLRNFAH